MKGSPRRTRSARRGAHSPPGRWAGPDVDALRFTLALRGYRMDEVDDVIDRLLDELDRRDARIAELERPTAAADDEAVDDEAVDDPRDDRRGAGQDA